MTHAFLAAMERILWLYAQPYNPKRPVVCFDERPCFLIGDAVELIAMQTGRIRKKHYAYEKNGSCALLAAIEPLTAKRVAEVYPQRRGKEFTLFCELLSQAFPEADKICLVLDNLNTHTLGSLICKTVKKIANSVHDKTNKCNRERTSRRYSAAIGSH